MFRLISVLGLIFFLSSCVSAKKVDKSYVLNQESQNGLFIISLEKYSNNEGLLFYIDILDEATNKKIKRLNILSREKEFLNVIELAEGNYILSDICAHGALKCNMPVHEPFQIKAGKGLYFGRVQLFLKGDDEYITGSYEIIKGIRMDEDVQLVDMYPNLKREDIVSISP